MSVAQNSTTTRRYRPWLGVLCTLMLVGSLALCGCSRKEVSDGLRRVPAIGPWLAGKLSNEPDPIYMPDNATPDAHVSGKINLTFLKRAGDRSMPTATPRTLPDARKDEPIVYAVEQLLAGPTEAEKSRGYYSEIPPGTRLLGVTHTGRAVRVNLSSEFASGGGSASMIGRLEELKRTLAGLRINGPVYVDVDGHQLEVLGGEGLEVERLLQP